MALLGNKYVILAAGVGIGIGIGYLLFAPARAPGTPAAATP